MIKFSAPPILPMYKANSLGANAPRPRASRRYCQQLLLNVCFVLVPLFLIFLFFMSIYMGSAFLQEHMDKDLVTHSSVFHNTLPNTRNVIKKWSIEHLHGIDLTSLNPPPQQFKKGLQSNYSQQLYHNIVAQGSNITQKISSYLRSANHQ